MRFFSTATPDGHGVTPSHFRNPVFNPVAFPRHCWVTPKTPKTPRVHMGIRARAHAYKNKKNKK